MAATLDLGNLLVHLRMDASQYMSMMRSAEARMKRTSQTLTRIGRQMTMRITLPLAAMGAASVKAFASFDDAMTKSLAIMSGITPQLRKEMESLATEISVKGVTSATDLAKSYFYLASAGLTARQSMAALGVVEKFAVAGAFDMALATDLATDAQSALGLTVKNARQNMINMTRVTDVLTGANTLANATTRQFSEALTSQAGPAMKAYGIELEEGVAVLAAYADQGIKAQRAGNMLSRMLRLMTKGFQDNREEWERLNINIFDATGELKPLNTIIGDLSKVLNNMSTEQRIAALNMLGFQARSQQAILPLLGLQDRIKEYNEELLKMGGITERVADKQLQSFSAQMRILWNNVKSAGREIGVVLAPTILKLGEFIKKVTKGFTSLNSDTKVLIVRMLVLIAAIGPVLLILGGFLKVLILVKAAALLGAGSIGVLTASFASLFAVVAAWSIGKYFYNEFKIVQQVASQVVINLMKGWEYIKFGFGQAVAGMRIAWDILMNRMKETLATVLSGMARIPGAGKLAKVAESLRASMSSVGKEMLEENKRILEEQLNFLERLNEEVFSDIEANFAEIKEVAAATTEEIVKVAEGATNAMGDAMEDLSWKMHDLFEDWVGSAIDTYSNLRDIANNALNGISDSLTDLVMTGKADFNELANSILRDITRMIIRAQIARAIMAFMPGLIPTPAAIPQAVYQVAAPIGHSGGIAGQMSARRMVPAATFMGAPRLHGGLRTDEIPTILEKGEEVLSKEEVSGRDKGSTVNITVQSIDSQDTYRFLDRNKRAIASMLQGTMQSNHPIRRFDR